MNVLQYGKDKEKHGASSPQSCPACQDPGAPKSYILECITKQKKVERALQYSFLQTIQLPQNLTVLTRAILQILLKKNKKPKTAEISKCSQCQVS